MAGTPLGRRETGEKERTIRNNNHHPGRLAGDFAWSCLFPSGIQMIQAVVSYPRVV